MADTFESLADAFDSRRDEGRTEAIQAARDHFYRGPIAEEIVEFSAEHDGYLTREDFEEFEADLLEAEQALTEAEAGLLAVDQIAADAKPGLGPKGEWATVDLDYNDDDVVNTKDIDDFLNPP